MIINRGNMNGLFTSFNATFRNALAARQATSRWADVAFPTRSVTSEESYDWLGAFPGLREWAGERVVEGLTQYGYKLVNKDFEQTVEVSANAIRDDKYGVYMPLFEGMGKASAAWPDQQVFPLLAAGFSTPCYDGQYFFDSDHPVIGKDGSMTTVSNTGGGAGTPWVLAQLDGMLKPFIWQLRQSADMLIRKDQPTDDNVFDKNQFVYGTHGRGVAGYGLWQFCFGSKQDLNAPNFEAARNALTGLKGDHGRPLGVMPTHLIIPTTLAGKAREILVAERNAQGATNIWRGEVEILETAWLN